MAHQLVRCARLPGGGGSGKAKDASDRQMGLGTLTRHLGLSPGLGIRWLILRRGILPASGGGWGDTQENVHEGPGQRDSSSQQVLAPLLPSGVPAPSDPVATVSVSLPPVQLAQFVHTEALGGGTGLGSRTVGHGCWDTLPSFMHCMWLSGFQLPQVTCAQPYRLQSPSGSHGSTHRDGGRTAGSMW